MIERVNAVAVKQIRNIFEGRKYCPYKTSALIADIGAHEGMLEPDSTWTLALWCRVDHSSNLSSSAREGASSNTWSCRIGIKKNQESLEISPACHTFPPIIESSDVQIDQPLEDEQASCDTFCTDLCVFAGEPWDVMHESVYLSKQALKRFCTDLCTLWCKDCRRPQHDYFKVLRFDEYAFL